MIDKAIIEQAQQLLLKQDKDGAQALARQVIDDGENPLELMQAAFIPAIKQVGELFGRGKLFLPELIKAADAMKAVTEMINAALSDSPERKGKAHTIVIATVKGDVHDIGKAIVVSLMRANGFTVKDLGRDVGTDKIIEEAVNIGADVIGTSALLTTTMPKQKELEEALKTAGLRNRFKTIVGGAPVTPRWAARIGADAYAEDAQDGIAKLTELMQS
jgi:corrinoid protein of di/trimethylamine methyltransferase